MKQLIIDFVEENYPSFDSFLGSKNQELLSILKSGISPLTFIWGPIGIGKSHLLKSWVKHRQLQGNSAILISMSQKKGLDELYNHHYDYIAIDDIHCFNSSSQIQLFSLFNEVLDLDSRLLVSADAPPQRLSQLRNDLRTRLGLCLIYEIFPLSEQEKVDTMREFINIRQTNIPDEVLNYLISHSPRNLDFLLNTLQNLDDYAIKNKRNITIPLLKQFLLENK